MSWPDALKVAESGRACNRARNITENVYLPRRPDPRACLRIVGPAGYHSGFLG